MKQDQYLQNYLISLENTFKEQSCRDRGLKWELHRGGQYYVSSNDYTKLKAIEENDKNNMYKVYLNLSFLPW